MATSCKDEVKRNISEQEKEEEDYKMEILPSTEKCVTERGAKKSIKHILQVHRYVSATVSHGDECELDDVTTVSSECNDVDMVTVSYDEERDEVNRTTVSEDMEMQGECNM